MVWAEHQELQPVRAGFERSRRGRGDPDGVARADRFDLVVDPYPAVAGQHHEHLLGVPVAVPERLAHAGPQALVADPRANGPERPGGEPSLALVLEAEPGRHVLDLLEIDLRVPGAAGEIANATERLEVG